MLDAGRLQRLIAVGRSLVSELDLDTVLDRLLETAIEITQARFAAVGVLDHRRLELSQFLTRGVDPPTHRAIGDLPRGRGILGLLINDETPLRLDDLSAHPASYGFPPGHPPMTSFLGVPIIVREEAWGNLYLTEKAGGFDADDEEAVVVLAAWAGIAIDNARLFTTGQARREELERAVRGFEATATIAKAIGGETDLARVLELITKRGRALVEARAVVILLRDGDELVMTAAAGEGAIEIGSRISIAASTTGEVLESRAARRVDDLAALRIPVQQLGVATAQTAIFVPLVYRGQGLGVLAAFDRLRGAARFTSDDQELLTAYAASAATAVATAQSVEADRLRRSMEAAEAERRRWARELHDETLQGLGGLKVLLGGARRLEDPERMRQAMVTASEHVGREIDNLRAIITELRPAALDELGLVPALRTLARRTSARDGLEVTTDLPDPATERLSPEIETAVYRIAQEALNNVAKHADATRATLVLRRSHGTVELEIADDGAGFDPATPTAGFGLIGMRERAQLAGGTLAVERSDDWTHLRTRLPVR
jgi:signal transduction histidine kinase